MNGANESEGHERGVSCFVAFALFRGFRVSESPADKELKGARHFLADLTLRTIALSAVF